VQSVEGFPVESPDPEFGFETLLQNLSYKVTYQLSQNNKISNYVQVARKYQPSRDASSTRYRNAVVSQDSITYVGNIEWNSIVSPQFFFTSRLSTFGYNFPQLPYGSDLQVGENRVRRRSDESTGNFEGSAAPTRSDRRRMQFDWNATYFKDNLSNFIRGSHAFKVGYLFEREGQESVNDGAVDSLTLTYRSQSSAPDFTTPYRVQLQNAPRFQLNYTTHQGAYITDQWTLNRHLTLNVGVRWDYYSSDYPDQEIVPGPWRDFFYAGAPLPNGYRLPISPYPDFVVPGRDGISRFPASFAPRVGVSWDLGGDGRNVLKFNWGRYYQNTGLSSGDVNPLQALTATFNWTDPNGDRLFQFNEFGSFVTSTGSSANTISPDLKHTYTDSVSAWYERQLAPNLAFRGGWTFRKDGNSEQQVQINRVRELYTERREFPDPGVDGILGNADDGPTIVAWDIPAGNIPPSLTDTRTVDGPFQIDRAIDLTLTKRMSNRWSATVNYFFSWDHDRGFAQTPNADRHNERTITLYGFKGFGTYQGPYGIVISPIVRYQSGDHRYRVVQLPLRTGTFDYEASEPGDYREDNILIFDVRFEKRFRFGGYRTLGLFLDAYNLGNSNAAETQDQVVGRRTTVVDGDTVDYQRFLRPQTILSPRILKFGVRLGF
jgi:hypothetical protein